MTPVPQSCWAIRTCISSLHSHLCFSIGALTLSNRSTFKPSQMPMCLHLAATAASAPGLDTIDTASRQASCDPGHNQHHPMHPWSLLSELPVMFCPRSQVLQTHTPTDWLRCHPEVQSRRQSTHPGIRAPSSTTWGSFLGFSSSSLILLEALHGLWATCLSTQY